MKKLTSGMVFVFLMGFLLLSAQLQADPMGASPMKVNPSFLNLENRSGAKEQGWGVHPENDLLTAQEAFRFAIKSETKEHMRLSVTIEPGYYLYRDRMQFSWGSNGKAPTMPWPKGLIKEDPYFGQVMILNESFELLLPKSPSSESQAVLGYQGCAEKGLCYAPETTILPIESPSSVNKSASKTTSLTGGAGPTQSREMGQVMTESNPSSPNDFKPTGLWSIITAFGAGLLLAFNPCSWPMLPILVAYLLQGKSHGWQGAFLAMVYALSMALSLAVLGALVAVFGAKFNLQGYLQSPWFLGPLILIFLGLAASLFGAWQLQLPLSWRNRIQNTAQTLPGGRFSGALGLGMINVLVISPCLSAPLAGYLTYIAIQQDVWGGWWQLFALGMGLGAPLIVLSAGGNALLPRSGHWLDVMRVLFGFAILAVAIDLLSRMVAVIWINYLWVCWLLALLLILTWKCRTLSWKGRTALLLIWVGIFIYVCHTCVQWQAWQKVENHESHKNRESHGWQRVTEAAEAKQILQEAIQAGKPVVLDWYAIWCTTCIELEREVFAQAEVKQALKTWVAVSLDISEFNEEHRDLMDHYRVYGPPTVQFFGPDGIEHRSQRLQGPTDSQDFLERLHATLNNQKPKGSRGTE